MGIMQDLYEGSDLKLLATANGGGTTSTYEANMVGSMDSAVAVLVSSKSSGGSSVDIDHADSRGGSYSDLTTLTTGNTGLSSAVNSGDEVLSVSSVSNFAVGDVIEINDSDSGNTEQAEIVSVDSTNNELTLKRKLSQSYTTTYGTVYTAVKKEELTSYDKFIKANSIAGSDVAMAAYIVAGKTIT